MKNVPVYYNSGQANNRYQGLKKSSTGGPSTLECEYLDQDHKNKIQTQEDSPLSVREVDSHVLYNYFQRSYKILLMMLMMTDKDLDLSILCHRER